MKKIRTLIISLMMVISMASPVLAVNPVQSVCGGSTGASGDNGNSTTGDNSNENSTTGNASGGNTTTGVSGDTSGVNSGGSGGGGSKSVCEASKGTNLLGKNGVITKVTSLLSYVAGIVAIITMSIGGFKYVTSQGEPGGVNSAKNTIIYAMVGLLIAIFAQGIVQFVLSKL